MTPRGRDVTDTVSLCPAKFLSACAGERRDHFLVDAKCLYGIYILLPQTHAERPIRGNSREERVNRVSELNLPVTGTGYRVNSFACRVLWYGELLPCRSWATRG